MGQRFAPSVANIYLTLWEEEILSSAPLCPIIWHRYIDDIFAIWRGEVNDLKHFLEFTNTYNPHIKITYEYNITNCIFLDLNIFKHHNKLLHKIHFKETNNHNLLHPTSNHPKHVFNGIVYSQIRRWAALTSLKVDFDNTCKNIFPIWHNNGYTKTMIRNNKNNVLQHLNLKGCWKHCFTPCTNCVYQEYLHKCTTYQIKGISYKIIGNYSCSTKNVIYVIYCDKCCLYYVGQCINFHERIKKHIYSIKSNSSILMHKHFWDNCTLQNFKCHIIDSCTTIEKLKIKESHYIKKFNSRTPNGLNIIENYSPNPTLILPFSKISHKISSNIKSICNKNKIEIKSVFKQGKSLSDIANKS